MPALAPAAGPPAVADAVGPSAPGEAAGRNWRANRDALRHRQPDATAALDAAGPPVTWATARDGSLWARDADRHWVAGCSVPVAAGRALLRSMAVEPGGHCLLAPAHVGLVVAARERLGPDPVLFVVHPDADRCRLVLAAADLTSDIVAGRLWCFAGDDWPDQFTAALERFPGLAVPTRFIRTRLTSDAAAAPLIDVAQQRFGRAAERRADRLSTRRPTSASLDRRRVLVIGGSRFRLWEDFTATLLAALPAGSTAVRHDTDDPLAASPLALADVADGCGVVLAADVARGDAAAVIPGRATWVTWVTRPILPTAETAAPGDRLILASVDWLRLADAAGWPRERVSVGTPTACPPPLADRGSFLGLIADVSQTDPPDTVSAYSSHRLLWDQLAAEIAADPLVVADPARFLADRATAGGIDVGQLDLLAFEVGLIRPGYTRALARRLIRGGLPVRLWGTGWDGDLEGHWAGPVTTSADLAVAIAACGAIVRPTPGTDWHPCEAVGLPVVHPGRDLLRAAATALRGTVPTTATVDTLSAAVARSLGA